MRQASSVCKCQLGRKHGEDSPEEPTACRETGDRPPSKRRNTETQKPRPERNGWVSGGRGGELRTVERSWRQGSGQPMPKGKADAQGRKRSKW